MLPYSPQQSVTVLQQSLISHNPVEFVLLEDMVLQLTTQRAPAWSPKLILSPGGWGEYKRGQESIRQVKDTIEQMWQDLVQSIFRARNDMVAWQAGARLREMQWAEQFRRDREQNQYALDYRAKQLQLEESIAKIREARSHSYAKEIMELQHSFETALMELKLGQDDPVVRMQRFLEALEHAKPILRSYAGKDDTHQVDSWIADAVLDGIRVLTR